MQTISSTLQPKITRCFGNRSANQPAGAAHSRKGSTSITAPSESTSAADSLPQRSLPIGTISQRNMLSFIAPRNCVISNPTKLRENSPWFPRPTAAAWQSATCGKSIAALPLSFSVRSSRCSMRITCGQSVPGCGPSRSALDGLIGSSTRAARISPFDPSARDMLELLGPHLYLAQREMASFS